MDLKRMLLNQEESPMRILQQYEDGAIQNKVGGGKENITDAHRDFGKAKMQDLVGGGLT